jgi:hypothetical protein
MALAAVASARAAAPEIRRPAGVPQGDGVAHTLRSIPEACASLQGRFIGEAASPYAFAAVRSSASCQPRARFVDAAKARPSEAAGWRLNDVIRVPSKDCAGLVAVVEVWRKPGVALPPKLDAQGRARLYLDEAKAKAKAGVPAAVTQYTAKVAVEGRACR